MKRILKANVAITIDMDEDIDPEQAIDMISEQIDEINEVNMDTGLPISASTIFSYTIEEKD